MSAYDVVISGGGPVGMGLAIELGQRGHSVAVVERAPEPQPIPKGQNLTQRTMEHIHAWGCEDELRAARLMPRGVANGGLVTYGTLLSDYAYDWLQREKVSDFYWRAVERLPQYQTERVLRSRVAELPSVEVFYGWSTETVAQDASGVTLGISRRDGAGTGPRELRGTYAVGCDGSRSTVRAAAGITETRSEHDRLMVLLVFRSEELDRLLAGKHPTRAVYNALNPDLDGYWLFLGRVDDRGEWFFHAPVPLGTTRENFDFKAYLHRAAGTEFDLEISHIGFWDLRVALADSYRTGRVFIAGDAAHSHPPYGGYGINTGFEDARNLGWKLSARLQGWGGEALLDSYDAERRPVFASTARDFIERFIEDDRDFLATYSPDKDRAAFERAWYARNESAAEVMAFEPNYEGSPVVAGAGGGSPGAVGSHEFRARPGHHLAPARLPDGSNVYEALGAGFTLLDCGAAKAETDAIARTAERLGLPLETVSAGGGTPYGARLVLVRPDNFVAWVGEDARGCDRVLATAAGQ